MSPARSRGRRFRWPRPTRPGTAPSRRAGRRSARRSSGWAAARRSLRRTRARSRVRCRRGSRARSRGSSARAPPTRRRVNPELISLRSCRCRGGSLKMRLPSCTGFGMRRVRDGDALGRGEQRRVARHEADVLVLQQRPEVGDVVPAHRRRRAQLPVRGIRVARVEVGGVQRESRPHGKSALQAPPGTRSDRLMQSVLRDVSTLRHACLSI